MQSSLWKRAIPTATQYSQLIQPQAAYLQATLLKRAPGTNSFAPWVGDEESHDVLFKTLQAMGVRYLVNRDAIAAAAQRKFVERKLGPWRLYELPHPNVGDYSPTNIILAQSAPEAVRIMGRDEFDFRRDVILADDPGPLVPGRDALLTVSRGGGFHMTGRSDGTTLILLPLQFSHCLQTQNLGISIVRANLMWAGVVFSKAIDTEISFQYGVFSPACRRADLADVKRLGMVLSRTSDQAN